MAIFELKPNGLEPVPALTFSESGIRHWPNVRRLLDAYVDVVAPGTLVLSADYCPSDFSSRVVLAVDRSADLVLVEFRTEQVRSRVELRALRLATMASSMTFDRIVSLHGDYLASIDSDSDPRRRILEFLGWEEVDEHRFGQDVRIVLASAIFSQNVVSAVAWLNEHGLDLRCVRLSPHLAGERIFLEVAQIVPLPDVPAFRALVRDREEAARDGDLRRYSVKLGHVEHEKTASRWAIWHVIKELVDAGVNPCLSQVVLKSSAIVDD